LSYLSF